MVKLNLLHQRFGMLLVIEEAPTYNNSARWLCQCDCGNKKIIRTSHLVNGDIKSCGCSSIKLQMQSKGCTGASYTRLYKIWISMRKRCLNPKHENYFKKGISVCQEWSSSFDNFYKWSMENGYSDNLTIDRINNNGNYEPNNCRWTDMTTQNRNKDIQKNNKTGCSGVYLYKKPSTYRATIGVNGKKISLGLFNTLKEAIDARKNAERMYWKVQ